MERVTLKVNQGIFSVEEIYLDVDPEQVFVLFVVINTAGECEWSVGSTSVEDNDKIYASVINQEMKQAVLAHALPILINALQIKALQPDSAEDQASYQQALEELAKIEL
ncbi:hypothetical protein EHS13_27315 [Paenibacillus psychroresistens]|uniref:Uncharacterized protein n=1 Tax=Paenibacillus psychroresistens TaxID=1778678 RepID=A0A6B8RPP6_9BACL|nr:hypothetical protein [Paenibacillus psychroresistens]QGQ98330.1 hypothetical protein EHS13_27315 [Paenibacillus psychroresistens]